MANPEHVELVKKGAKVLNAWREKYLDTRLDLVGANLEGTNLEGTNFRETNLVGANLEHANFRGANLEHANFRGANFRGANFRSANLRGANFVGANLEHANFRGANLVGANLVGTNLWSANLLDTNLGHVNLTRSRIWDTTFANCDLRGVIGLEAIYHDGPSTIGIDTILRSEGDIPHVFLKGCGVPDHVIDMLDSISKKPIQFYSCFLSHSADDKPFAKHLFDKLQGAGVRCWYFPESARTGEKLWDEINKAIRIYDKLVIICTYNSLCSEAVIKEIKEGLQREQEELIRRNKDEEKVVKGEWTQEEFARQRYHTKVLFPIALDDYVFTDWNHPLKFELQKNRVIGDFRNWENFKTFDKAFQKLLKDLNSSD